MLKVSHAIFVLSMTFAFNSPMAQTGSISVGGTTRTFIVYAPAGLPDKPALVISMHGLGGSGSQQRSMSRFDQVADKGKFLVVYPDGNFKMGSSNGWDITTDADVEFISALVDTMEGRYGIDRNKVYATGFSMGGMMSYKLACAVPELVAAIGPASGYPLFGNNDCSPDIPVPVCHTHGSTDDVVDYNGVENWIEKFVSANGCPATAVNTNISTKIRREYWGPCEEGSEVILYHFEGMYHAYPTSSSQGFSASDTFWTFFEKHPRGAVGTAVSPSGSVIRKNSTVAFTAGVLNVYGDNLKGIRLTDMQGRSIAACKPEGISKTGMVLPVGRLPAGVYIVTVRGLSGVDTRTFMIP
ncbi:MAG: dienelactone hydrolase family protein [Chitinispirillaceae bacterium]|nr:dienelactone hydrolase family protein [Chitinispirillaceae bacterium]